MAKASTLVTATRQAQIVDLGSPPSERLFYLIAGCAMLILTAVGFREFYLHGKGFGGIAMTQQIIPLIVLHGLWTTGWVIFFIFQSTLMLTGNKRVHTAIGLVGAVLALAVVIGGTAVAALSVYFNPGLYEDFGGPRYSLVIMIFQMLMFGTLVGIGLGSRLEIHHPMMLLATVVMMSASLSRFPYTTKLARVPPLYTDGPMLLFGGLLFLVHWGNDQSCESVVCNRLCRSGACLFRFRRTRHPLESNGRNFRSLKVNRPQAVLCANALLHHQRDHSCFANPCRRQPT